MKKIVSYLLVGSMILGSFSVTSSITAFAGQVKKTEIEAESEQSSTGVHVTYRTEEEILQFAKEHPYVMKSNKLMEKKASMKKPYTQSGEISEEHKKAGLNALNLARYIAGLDANVTLDESYNQMVQAGAYVNAINDEMTHYPTKPTGMDESMYQLGAQGCRSSNLALGYETISDAVFGWLSDEDDSNVDRVGHRRWILNPSLGKTGFGYVNGYSGMYAFDGSGSGNQTGVAWPAQTMPIEYLNDLTQVEESAGLPYLPPMNSDEGDNYVSVYPWSYSYGSSVDAEKIQVTLTRERDQKQWKFSTKHSDGRLFVNNDGYGQSGCIIFQPAGLSTFYGDDRFHVEIIGLEQPVSYDVTLFSLDENAIEEALKKWMLQAPSTLFLGGEVDGTGTVSSYTSGKFNGKLTLKSSNEKVLQINGRKLTPKKVGKATIIATYQIKDQTRTIKKVIQIKKPSLVMSKYKKTLKVGSAYQFRAKQEGLKGKITYSVSNKKVATINSKTGTLKALKKGKVTVIAKLGKRQAKVSVTVK